MDHPVIHIPGSSLSSHHDSVGGISLLQKTAVFEFLQRPVIDQLFQFDVADGRICILISAGYCAGLPKTLRAWVGDLNQVLVSLCGDGPVADPQAFHDDMGAKAEVE